MRLLGVCVLELGGLGGLGGLGWLGAGLRLGCLSRDFLISWASLVIVLFLKRCSVVVLMMSVLNEPDVACSAVSVGMETCSSCKAAFLASNWMARSAASLCCSACLISNVFCISNISSQHEVVCSVANLLNTSGAEGCCWAISSGSLIRYRAASSVSCLPISSGACSRDRL